MSDQSLAKTEPEISIEEKFMVISNKMDAAIKFGASQKFNEIAKVFAQAKILEIIDDCLTGDIMAPIMKLQGSRSGFKTDKDKADNPGYTEGTVRRCIKDGLAMGLRPINNEINIIAGEMYPTKEGYTKLLFDLIRFGRLDSYDIDKELPVRKEGIVTVACNIEWVIAGIKKAKRITVHVSAGDKVGNDTILGKADRKSRKWVYEKITGQDMGDADVMYEDEKPIKQTSTQTTSTDTSTDTSGDRNANVEELQILEETENDKAKDASNGAKVIDEVEQKKMDSFLAKAIHKEDLKRLYGRIEAKIPKDKVHMKNYDALMEKLPTKAEYDAAQSK